MENLEINIPPSLHINFDSSLPRLKSKSHTNSPKVPADPHYSWFHQSQKEISPTLKQNPEISETFQHKLQGLEEFGLFSEFLVTKPKNRLKLKEENTRKSTIYLTDFMMPVNKRKLLQNSGGLDLYLSKRKEYQSELIKEQSNLNDFFQHKEKKPEFFFTPQISTRYLPKCNQKNREDPFSKKHLDVVDCIIDKCDEAMKIKVPLNSNSCKGLKGESLANANKSRKMLAKLTEQDHKSKKF